MTKEFGNTQGPGEDSFRRGGKRSANRAGEVNLRINRRIRAKEVRVIDPEGRQLGIMPPELAMQKANDLGFDLVEISPEAVPPVCRIMDYGKFKYAQKKKVAEAKKHQTTQAIKEVKFRPKIETHDYNFKVDAIRRFLGEGHKAKVTMMFRGREIAHQDRARDIMTRIAADVKEAGTVESLPRLEGRNMVMVVAPGHK
jgi:translation initiation factor IF-3